MVFLTRQLGSMAAFFAMAQAVQLTFDNKCSYPIELFDNLKLETVAVGASTIRTVADGFHGMFRHGKSDQATLAEFTISGGKTWFDISVVPPGSGNCRSFADCAQATKRTGFNVAMSIIPDTTKISPTCRPLVCESKSCADAYLFPSDDKKTHDCPDNVPFQIVFCPNGGNSAPAAPQASANNAAAPNASGNRNANPSPNATANGNGNVNANATATNGFDRATKYESGTVAVHSVPQDNGNATKRGGGNAESFPSATIKAGFTYSGKLAGNVPGTYQMVTNAAQCSRQTVSVNSPVGPMSEEVTMVFRGPMNIYNIAVFDGSSGGDWTRVSSYAMNEEPEDLVFMNNWNVDYSGGKKSPQGFATADGARKAPQSTRFGGVLKEASDPSKIGGGSGVQTGAEVNIMREAKCAEDKACKGYYDENGHHGWNGGKKMFVTKVVMPQGSAPNQPAIWMLNAQIVRSSQYQCNCRGMGPVGGCGELDIAEVIETNGARDKVSTHYYFYDGSIPSGRDNYAPRPFNTPTTYVTIIDDSGEGTIKILEMGENDFDFSASSVSDAQIKTWLGTGGQNVAKQY